MIQGLMQDLRYSLRQIRRSPGFSFFVVATLAVGIGANTTIFSAANTLLVKPLPWEGSERMVRLYGAYEGRGNEWSVSLPNAEDWRALSTVFDDVAWYQGASVSVADEGTPERLVGVRSSANLLGLLGARPLIGRAYSADETHPDGERVVVLSHGLWQRRYAGAPDVLGRTISLSGLPHTIVGVMPEDFAFPSSQSELYLPLRSTSGTWNRANGGLQLLGRLREGVTIEQAQADMNGVSARLAAEHPSTNADLSAFIRPLRDALYGGGSTSLTIYLLLGGVAFVLLIACVNVANLLLARATSREREIAVRAAIGAGRGRVVRQLVTESLVLAAFGGAAGVLLAVWGVRALGSVVPATSGLPSTFAIDGVVLGFTAALVVLTGVLFGLAPAVQTARVELTTLMGGRTGASSRRRGRSRAALVIAEVALASILLVCAGVMIRSMVGLLGTDPGFRADNVLTLRVALDASYESAEQVSAFQQQVLERLRTLPGAVEAGAVDFIPLGGTNNYNDFHIEGVDGNLNAGSLMVSPGYIEAMSIPLLRGRTFTAQDAAGSMPVVVISRGLAERYWPGEDPVGRRLLTGWEGGANPNWRTIIGVVGDVRHGGLDNDPRAEFYIPFAQLPWAARSLTFAVRTQMDPNGIAAAGRDAVWSIDPKQPVYDVRTMDRLVRESNSVVVPRLMAGALAIFGMLALLLAALGLYGVISYNVAQRTYEIGVRAALGARSTDVLALVLRQGMALVAIGLGIGLAGALAVTRLLRSLLFEVSPTDPVAFAGMAGVLLVVAVVATIVPARRAAGIDPMSALRAE
jgi:putative ABC transport system permease protein